MSIGSTIRLRSASANATHAFRRCARRDVLLLELAVRLEEDERDALVEVVLQIRADLLIRALGVAGDPLEVLLVLRVVVDLEVVGLVDVPLELVVVDVVLAVVRRHLRLRVDGAALRVELPTSRASPESAFARSTHLRLPEPGLRRTGRWKHCAGRACAYDHLVKSIEWSPGGFSRSYCDHISDRNNAHRARDIPRASR